MKTSFITTVFNEEKTIMSLLHSVFDQSLLPDEIVIVDAGSTDKTVTIMREYVQLNAHIPSTLIIKKGNRSTGRNEAIRHASGEIILCSDAGCVLDRDWVKNLVEKFQKKDVAVVSGYYKPVTLSVFEKCIATYVCVMPDQIDTETFLPATRSIAFKKSAWEKVDGFPEYLDTCEDMVFDKKLKNEKFEFVFAKNAIVYWSQRKNLIQAFRQFFTYAQGDGKACYFRPQTFFLFFRYIVLLFLFYLFLPQIYLLLYIIVSLGILYSLWAIGKNYKYVNNPHAVYLLPLLQITADIAVIWGTTTGLLDRMFSLVFLPRQRYQMNNFNTVFKNTLFLTISEIFLKGIGVLWVLFLAHSLSVDSYGRYNLVNSLIGMFSFLPDLGVGLIVIREIAQHREKAPYYLGNSLILNCILSTITVCIIFITTLFIHYPPEVNILLFISSLTLLISTLRSVGIFFFDGTERMGYSAVLNSLNTVFLLCGASIGLLMGYGLRGIFTGMLIGTCLSLIITWSTTRKFLIPTITFDWRLIKHLISEGFPLGLAGFSSLVYSEIDTVIISKMLNEHFVGIYTSATPFIFSLIQLLNVPFVVAVYPALTRISVEDKKRFVMVIIKSLGVIALWSIPLACIISLSAQYIIPLLFGGKYREAIPVLRLLIFFVPFASLSALLYKILIILRKQYIYLFITLFGVLLNILLNIFLIPLYALYGAALASVLTQILLFILFLSCVIFSVRQSLQE